jgi:uncharacterized protein (DUF433 family)
MSTQAVVEIGDLVTRSPGICGGRPRIRGTSVSVHRIVGWYKLGLGAEAIARKIGHRALRDVSTALAYYHANAEEIERLLAEEAEDYERLARESASARGDKR